MQRGFWAVLQRRGPRRFHVDEAALHSGWRPTGVLRVGSLLHVALAAITATCNQI
jgi:hypothetical protein